MGGVGVYYPVSCAPCALSSGSSSGPLSRLLLPAVFLFGPHTPVPERRAPKQHPFPPIEILLPASVDRFPCFHTCPCIRAKKLKLSPVEFSLLAAKHTYGAERRAPSAPLSAGRNSAPRICR